MKCSRGVISVTGACAVLEGIADVMYGGNPEGSQSSIARRKRFVRYH